MKKLLLLLFLCASTLYAQTEKINFDLKEGTDQSISIINIEKITLEGQATDDPTVTVVLTDGADPIVIHATNIEKVSFYPADLSLGMYLHYNDDTPMETVLTSSFDEFIIAYETSVEEVSTDGDLAFTNNYPNPFSESTTIEFNLQNPGMTNAEILDVHGSTVLELQNENLASGSHQLVWTGNDASGNKVQSGIYICRVQTGQSVIMKKIMLVK